jgi:peptidoglycan LD-endopeptidase LytH
MMDRKSRNIDETALSIIVIGPILLAFLFIPLSKGNNVQPKRVHAGEKVSAEEKAPVGERVSAKVYTDSQEEIEDLRNRKLLFPLKGFTSQGISDSFRESRGNHRHEAIDIVAPRNTPIVAVESGTIARLWYSKNGGITIYQFDPTSTYAYYYAHLQKYADNLKEQDWVEKGQVIGYVGTSGNAPPGTPHLHFTIFKLTEEKHWWEGSAINPYDVYMSQSTEESM